jgi:hypothetical protein
LPEWRALLAPAHKPALARDELNALLKHYPD